MRKLIFATLLLGVLCACESIEVGDTKQPQAGEQTPEAGYTRLTLKAEPSRASLSGEKILWHEGDMIRVNGSNYDVQFDDKGEAYVNVPAEKSYTALFPAEIATEGGMALQPAQFYAEESFGAKANPMYGVGSDTELHLRSVCGVLMLRIAGEATISSVAITDRAGGALCGDFDYADGEASLRTDAAVKHPSVVLNCENVGGVELSASGTDFYVVMPAGTYSSGLKISICDTDGRAMVINSSTPRTIRVNEILETPVITYAPDEDLLLAEYFDKNVWGCERKSELDGFAIAGSTLTASGYELATGVTTTYGTDAISTTWDTAQVNQMSSSYLASRGLEDWQMLFRCREIYGALAVGSPAGRGFLRLPKLSLLEDGEVCKATLTFRIAFKSGTSADMLQLYPFGGGTGKVLEYYVDGVKIETPKDGDRWTTGTNIGLSVTSMSQEKLLINPALDMKNAEWHDVRIELGAVTNTTQIHFQPHTTGATYSEFLVDDIEIRKVEYPYQEDAEHYVTGSGAAVADVSKLMLEPSTLVYVGANAQLTYLPTHAKVLGIDNIDMLLKVEYVYDTLGGEWEEPFAALKAKFDDAGVKVWCIHMPYSEYQGVNIFDFCNSDASLRASAIARMKELIAAVEVFEPKYVLVHPAGYTTNYEYKWHKDYLITAMNELIPEAQKIGATLCLENLGNRYSLETSLTMQPSYINAVVAACPGLKVCVDVTHAVVHDINDAAEFIKALGENVSCVHMHDSDRTDDRHLYPGYSGVYSMQGTLDWGAIYKALVQDAGYRGPFTYELSTYAVDCLYSYNNLIHNYYDYVYPCYREAQ
ncbi:MAG: sugar phosphate isomerase/epimerase [Alistipes sp.]|nr:sugar phosphate isomerase/epimerase [Alistipes sp.]